jgi:hypothetical protein
MQALVNGFDQAVLTATLATQRAHQLDASGNYEFPLDQRELITQAAFVRIFVAFEEFLEKSFEHYGMGGQSLAGNTATCYAAAPSAQHLQRMFIGLLRFMDWSTPEKVRELAGLYFANGEPFDSPIAAVDTTLRDMKTVRNAASHVSTTTTAQAEALYARWTSQPLAGATAYQVLTALGTTTGTTFMTHAEQVLRGVVMQVANH